MHSILTRFNILACVALLALLAACSGAPAGGDTQPEDQPGISISAADETVAPEATLRLRAALSGSGASEADIHWSATAGQLSPETGAEVDWTAPAAAGSYGITAQLGTDGTGASDSITITVAEAGSGGPGGDDGDEGDGDSGKDDGSDDGNNGGDDPAGDDGDGDDDGNGNGDDDGNDNGGDDGDGNGNGNGDDADDGDASAPGSLQVTVDSSLPEITLTVSGPDGFSTIVTSSETLEGLEPGEYEFTAPEIDRNYGVYSARFEPTDRVVVKPAESAAVTVSYHPGPVVTVINNSDDVTEAGSIRYLLRLAADTAPDISRIEFDPDTFSGPAPVVTVGSQLIIASGLDLTISASENNPVELRRRNPDTPGRVLNVEDTANLELRNLTLNGNGQAADVQLSIAQGGVIRNAGQLSLYNVTVKNGAAQNGGGIYSSGQLTIGHSTISGNRSAGDGGGVYARGSVVIEQSIFAGNRSFNGSGGGLMLHRGGELEISESTFDSNRADKRGGGIGIEREATLLVRGSTFSGNSTDEAQGGAAWLNGWAEQLRIENSTFSGNSSATYGGAISAAGDLSVLASTIVANSSTGIGGGIAANADGFSLIGTIVAGNNGTNDLHLNALQAEQNSGDIRHNVTGTAGGVAGTLLEGGGANFNHVEDPQLYALADNGGPTRTMMPRNGSPALNAIPERACQRYMPGRDQRGERRRTGSNGECDIGAVQVQ